jgi:hypothetical protein
LTLTRRCRTRRIAAGATLVDDNEPFDPIKAGATLVDDKFLDDANATLKKAREGAGLFDSDTDIYRQLKKGASPQERVAADILGQQIRDTFRKKNPGWDNKKIDEAFNSELGFFGGIWDTAKRSAGKFWPQVKSMTAEFLANGIQDIGEQVDDRMRQANGMPEYSEEWAERQRKSFVFTNKKLFGMTDEQAEQAADRQMQSFRTPKQKIAGAKARLEFTSLSGHRVCRVLDRLVMAHGHPQRIVLDNGPEFTGKALNQWACEHRVTLQFIEPGKPVQNAFVESFNGTLRNECLNEHWFISLTDAKQLVEDWRIDYNQNRPHSSLGDQTPAEFAILPSPWGGQTVPINNNPTMESSHNN